MANVLVYQLEGGIAVVEVDTNQHQVQGGLFALSFMLDENYTPPATAGTDLSNYFYAC